MESPIKPIIVPYDFTPVADNALLHAVQFANASGSDVILLHIAATEADNDEKLKQLEKVAQEITDKHAVETDAVVREGDIFKTIKAFANDLDAIMVIMGTHGIRGMQKFTGSWALKVIAGSQVPFIVVQDEPQDDQFSNIVFPIDFKGENREKLRWANFLSHFYKTRIFICTPPKPKDESLRHRTNTNIAFAKKYMSNKGITYDLTELPGRKSFGAETIEYAKNVNGGMIIVMTTKNIGFTDYLFGATEQKIIANEEKIPVMCVNPREDLSRSGGFKTSGGS